MTKMEALVQDLFTFRDRFFETHPIELAREKREMVDKKMKEVLDDLDQLALKEDIEEETLEKKAYRTYLKGRVLNVAPDHCPEAEQLLSKAVKLEPNLVNAWIELGECYWKRGEVETAKTCFEGALSHVMTSSFVDKQLMTSLNNCAFTKIKLFTEIFIN